MPTGHTVPSLPTPFHVKGWAPELIAPVALKAVWSFGAVIVMVAVAGWVELSIHVAWLLANCAVVPFTTTVAPTSESACVVCALSYTILTVGDGLVTQIPALIVSTSAGLLVSKAGVAGPPTRRCSSSYPQALGMSGAVMVVMALLPGIPLLPFLFLGGGAGALAYIIDKRTKLVASTEARKTEAAAKTGSADARLRGGSCG